MVHKQLPQTLATQRQLLHYLANGEVYSGEWLAEQLGISRAAVAKHIDQLQQLGLDIYAMKAKGYRLAAPIRLLDGAVMRQHMQSVAPDVVVQHITDSTNSQLMNRLRDGNALLSGFVLVAEAQTAGRGRRGNTWLSPFGSNLYFSMYWSLQRGLQAAMGLSLVIGVVVAELLEQHYGIDVQLKWPNDIYIAGKKVGGILVELAGQSHANCDVVIGLGLNMYLASAQREQILQPVTALADHTAAIIDRNLLIPLLQQRLIDELQLFEADGFSTYVERFNQRDCYRHQRVQISGAQPLVGVCRGVDSQGALLLETAEGVQTLFGGEVSLRPEGLA